MSVMMHQSVTCRIGKEHGGKQGKLTAQKLRAESSTGFTMISKYKSITIYEYNNQSLEDRSRANSQDIVYISYYIKQCSI
jgi:hypothetical protein